MTKKNLFELLGRPVAASVSEHEALFASIPAGHDNTGVRQTTAHSSTIATRAGWETYDDDSVLPTM